MNDGNPPTRRARFERRHQRVALIIAVVVLLGIGWLAAAIPTVAVVGLGAGVTALSHRWLAARKKAAKG